MSQCARTSIETKHLLFKLFKTGVLPMKFGWQIIL